MDKKEGGREIFPIAHIRNGFWTKFGIPRQSGLVDEVVSCIVFGKEYRDPNAFRGLPEYSHLWLLWEFSGNVGKSWSPTVKPPRLGGNEHIGVFATRSPFRPNPLGLSCVRLLEVVQDKKEGPLLFVAGADLMDGTPIYDIKPYLSYTDSHPDARCGFADGVKGHRLRVNFPQMLMEKIGKKNAAAVCGILACDPRPAYQHDAGRVYGMEYAGYDIRFFVAGEELTVCEVVLLERGGRKN